MSQAGRYLLTNGGAPIETLTGNSGGAVGPTGGNINIVGSGTVTVAGNPGTSTLTISIAGGGLMWNEVLGAAQAMSVNNGYVPNNAGLVTLTLPAAAAFGDSIRITGKGAGGWIIAQNIGQTIHFGAVDSTTGVGGSVASTNRYDTIELICTTANTDWNVLSCIGNMLVT